MDNTQIEVKTHEFIDALHVLEEGSVADANKLTALFADEATIRNPALDIKGTTIDGKDAILGFWTEYKETLGQIHSKFHHVTVSPDAAGLFWTTSGTRPSGENVEYHGSTLIKFDENGKISYLRGYYDSAELTVKAVE